MTTTGQVRDDINVCVIGAGVCGLVATKVCLESGFKVTCFDRSPHFGGLWNYKDLSESYDANGEFIPSVMRTTILNTSKELSAFSDFPPPPDTPNFMKHDLYMNYIKNYVEHFRILPHLKLGHQIIHCEPKLIASTSLNSNEQDTLANIKWIVEVKDLQTGEEHKLQFDKLIVAIGHHNIPFVPTFNEQHKFKGQIIHSAKIKNILTDERLIDKRVVVVGLGNSACDAANDIALVAKKCYVSCHRGQWFKTRMATKGLSDFAGQSRWNFYKTKCRPTIMNDRSIIQSVESRFSHKMLGLTPKHKPSELVPAINDLFPFRVFTGGACLKSSIAHFTEDGVVFDGEDDVDYKVDIVVLATGYSARVTFMNEFELGLKSAEQNEYDLFLNIFAPKLTIPGVDRTPKEAIKSLAFIGLVQPSGSITVISEMQSRYVAQIFAGKLELPVVNEMLKFGQKFRTKRSKSVRSHSRDQLIGSWVGYIEEIASRAGVKPNLSKLFVTDFNLWRKLVFGPLVPYQYRLTGPGAWDKARETILSVDERVYMGINEGKNHILFQSRRRLLREDRLANSKQDRCNINNNKVSFVRKL